MPRSPASTCVSTCAIRPRARPRPRCCACSPAGARRWSRNTASSPTWLAAERGDGGMGLDVVLMRGLMGGAGAPSAGEESEEGGDVEGGGEDAGRERWLSMPWVPLPRDLAPGESAELRVAVRRPPGPVRLRLKPRLIGRASLPFRWLGSAVWERAL